MALGQDIADITLLDVSLATSLFDLSLTSGDVLGLDAAGAELLSTVAQISPLSVGEELPSFGSLLGDIVAWMGAG